MKKIIGALLMVVTIAHADIGVVVTKSGTVIEKDVYAGDTSGVSSLLIARQAADPTLSFQTYTLPDPAFDSTVMPPNQTQLRNDAANELNADFSGNAKFIRAVLLVILDEVNTIRTNPALNLTPRTAAQMKTAIQNKINSGAAD